MNKEINCLLDELGSEPTYTDMQRVGNKLLKLPVPEDLPATKQVRIVLASSFTIDPIAPALAVECHKIGLHPIIQIDGFNLYQSHILDLNSSLYKFKPDIVLLSAELSSVMPLEYSIIEDAEIRIKKLVEDFKRHSSALLVMHNFVVPSHFPFTILQNERQSQFVDSINKRLADIYKSDSQVRILDFEALCAYHGKSRITNSKLHYLGAMEISESFLPIVAKQYIAYIKALKGLTHKCIVLDGDNTLWGGILGEDGIDGINLSNHGVGSEYYDFQKAILALHKRGVILAINSKNNQSDVMEVLHEHPDMMLREKHFASLQINWNDKAANLQAIAKELNIGLDSLVFMDDSPIERAWIRQSLPEVLVVDLPSDPMLYAQTLEGLTDFEILSLTEEDTQRGALYATERVRHEFKKTSDNFEEFLAGLKTVLTIGVAEIKDIPRVAQLTRRTNQFNMTTHRYTDAETMEMVLSQDILVYTLRVRDVFGDSGLVGLIILKKGEVWKIDTFLMSCRVLGRTIEQAFLNEVLADAINQGAFMTEGRFIPTAKNVLASNFYKEFGFTFVTENEEHILWQLDVSKWTPKRSEWFTIEWSVKDAAS